MQATPSPAPAQPSSGQCSPGYFTSHEVSPSPRRRPGLGLDGTQIIAGFALFIAAIIVLAAAASPDRPLKDKQKSDKKAEALPDLRGETSWGTLTQDGANFTIEGNDRWKCVGTIRKDGKAQVIWTLLSSGEACPAVYEIKTGGGH
ncbi:MAG TPA: hypothetical protein VFE62_01630 [Gemmataceae bacterium]|nr:hypothetical protein [Gemmataceae bacterium]